MRDWYVSSVTRHAAGTKPVMQIRIQGLCSGVSDDEYSLVHVEHIFSLPSVFHGDRQAWFAELLLN
jgi:hypothetical protein